ncbi:MAG: hypothetical protein O3C28_06150 [Proteobacteria bacterium]|nr:hypothetical protein [Pseudomonadota bacterium]
MTANRHLTLGLICHVKPSFRALMIAFYLASSNLWQLSAVAYPLDAYEKTGIGRLEYMQRVEKDLIKDTKQPSGALLPTEEVDIRLVDRPDMELPPNDGIFRRQVEGLLGSYANRYAVSVLDISDPDKPRYTEVNGDVARNPGSVGKLVVALGLYQALADLYPDDLTARWNVLHDTRIIADEFIISDSHTVRMWDRENAKLIRRPLKIGDSGSMLEYLDWMISPSANAAAATLTKHGMLLTHFGKDYPVDEATGKDYFTTSARSALTEQLATFIQTPLTRNGLDLNKLRQGSFFTHTGKRKVQGTSSYATSRELMKFMLKMEQGKLVDEFSSREMKRLMYVTERRIRYASAPALSDSAVYFKSGSLFQCAPEPDFVCRKYQGNVQNFMNSVAIIESPAHGRKLHYIVTLMSNVLRRNSAVDHQSFATRLHRLIEAYHKPRIAPATDAQAEQPSHPPSLPTQVQ